MKETAPASSGFSLIEVLVALMMVVVMVTVIAQAVLASHRAEDSARELRAARLAAQRLAALAWLDDGTEDLVESLEEEWYVSEEIEAIGDGRFARQVWKLSPLDRPGRSYTFSVHAGE